MGGEDGKQEPPLEASIVGAVDGAVPCSEAVAGYAEGRENGKLREEVADCSIEDGFPAGAPKVTLVVRKLNEGQARTVTDVITPKIEPSP